ncbi:hypothetical protein F2Q69_00051776 [Brassica cretica]|uniref:DUF3700 domain-containing protein n=1 Tax=Brassica cretica TaxID=69181 RepID=A0A8S9PPN5_BRACR|nr:hypothetical protein F2Q69_00051776 [Brassica cretica]
MEETSLLFLSLPSSLGLPLCLSLVFINNGKPVCESAIQVQYIDEWDRESSITRAINGISGIEKVPLTVALVSSFLIGSFGAKDEISCLFQGSLDNLGSLKQQYGLAKNANEVLLVIEVYKSLRDRAPYPANHVVSHLSGDFAFVVFDKSTSALFVASVSSF